MVGRRQNRYAEGWIRGIIYVALALIFLMSAIAIVFLIQALVK